MKSNTTPYPLTKLPPTLDLTLFLIREELRSQKFFHALSKAGIDDIYYQPHLDRAILMNLGMDDGRLPKLLTRSGSREILRTRRFCS